MSTKEITLNEMIESLTGFDEIAVQQHFDVSFLELETKPTTWARALVFVDKRREGLSDADAKKASMEMRFGDVNEYFAEDAEEFDADQPDSESGKEGSQPE